MPIQAIENFFEGHYDEEFFLSLRKLLLLDKQVKYKSWRISMLHECLI